MRYHCCSAASRCLLASTASVYFSSACRVTDSCHALLTLLSLLPLLPLPPLRFTLPLLQSYGLNVARLAHLPESVILRAKAKSEEFEAAVEAAKRGELRLASSPTAGASAGAGAGSSGGSEGIGADSDADAWAAFYDAADSFSAGGTEIAAAALVSTARRLRGLAE